MRSRCLCRAPRQLGRPFHLRHAAARPAGPAHATGGSSGGGGTSSSPDPPAHATNSSSAAVGRPHWLAPLVWDGLSVLDVLAVPWGLKQATMAFMACAVLGIAPPAEYYLLNVAIAREYQQPCPHQQPLSSSSSSSSWCLRTAGWSAAGVQVQGVLHHTRGRRATAAISQSSSQRQQQQSAAGSAAAAGIRRLRTVTADAAANDSCCSCSAVLCYEYDLYKGQASLADRVNTPHRIALLQQHDPLVKAVMAASLLAVLYSLAALPARVLQLFVPGIALTSAYWLPIMPSGQTIKQVPGAKNLFTATVETLALVFFAVFSVPPAAAAGLAASKVAAIAAFCVLVNTALSLLADVRDVEGDRLVGTRSVAVLYGPGAALKLAGSCCLAACLVALLGLPHAWAVSGSAVLVMAAIAGFAAASGTLQQSATVVWRVLDSWFHALVGVVGLLAVV